MASKKTAHAKKQATMARAVVRQLPQAAPVFPESVIKSGINTALMILGGVSVIMIVYAGFRFTLASGDPQAVKAARNTILYAVAGIVIAILSYTIVNWVTDNLSIK